MTERERQEFQRLGQMVHGMIRDVHNTVGPRAYGRRTVDFPGGEVVLLVCNPEVAKVAEAGIAAVFEVSDWDIPKSQQQ